MMITKKISQLICLFAVFVMGLSLNMPAFAAFPDAEITLRVKSALSHSPIARHTKITVETKDGVVRLSGQVKTETLAQQIISLVSHTKDVVDVDPTFLQVTTSGQPVADSYINTKVQAVLIQYNLTASKYHRLPVENISIETRDGVVYLNGSAATEDQIYKVIELAKAVHGVMRVNSALHLD